MANLNISRRLLSKSRILFSKPNISIGANSLLLPLSRSSQFLRRTRPHSFCAPLPPTFIPSWWRKENSPQGTVPVFFEVFKPEGDLSRDELVNFYVQTLATVLGRSAGDEICVDEPWRKDTPIRGEPFIDGKAIPYDPKYYEDWEVRFGPLEQEHEYEEEEEDDEEEYGEEFPEGGCDFKHWVVHVDKFQYKGVSRDEIISSYITGLANAVFKGDEGEARWRIYKVSTKVYHAFSVYLGQGYEGHEVFLQRYIPGVELVAPDLSYALVNLGLKLRLG